MKKIIIFTLIFFASVLNSQKKNKNNNVYVDSVTELVYNDLSQKIKNISENVILNNSKFDKKIDSIFELYIVSLKNFEEKKKSKNLLRSKTTNGTPPLLYIVQQSCHDYHLP